MKIALQRLHNAENLGMKEVCVLCEVEFRVESILGIIDPIFEPFWENVCPACIEYFGKRNPERFATIEEYREAIERYPEAVWASGAEIERLQQEDLRNDDDAYWRMHDESWVGRSRPDWIGF